MAAAIAAVTMAIAIVKRAIQACTLTVPMAVAMTAMNYDFTLMG